MGVRPACIRVRAGSASASEIFAAAMQDPEAQADAKNTRVKVRDGEDMSLAEDEAKILLRQRHRLRPGQDDDFSLRNLAQVAQLVIECALRRLESRGLPATDEIVDRIFSAAKASKRTLTTEQIQKIIEEATSKPT